MLYKQNYFLPFVRDGISTQSIFANGSLSKNRSVPLNFGLNIAV